MIVFALFFFLLATISTYSGKDLAPGNEFKPWLLPFIALLHMMYPMAMHLKGSIKSNTGALFPHYRRNQLIAAGFILALFILVPVLIRGLQGFHVLAPLAMFLFAANLILWAVFVLGENFFILPVIVWLGKLVHEMLGFKAKIMILPSLPDSHLLGLKGVFPFLIILLSCGLFFFYVIYVLRMPYKDSWDRTGSQSPNLFSANSFTLKILRRKMAAVRRNMAGEKKRPLFRMARVLQPALFSPGYSLFINTLIFTLSFLFLIGTLTYMSHGGNLAALEIKFSSISLLVLFYFMGAGIMTTDLLQHRRRLPELWLRVPLNSRKDFTRATILTYLLVAGRQYFVSSIAVFIFCAFLRMTVLKSLLAVASGFIIYTVILALSLLFSERVVSHECKGWTIFTVVSGTTCFVVFGLVTRGSGYGSPAVWWFILAAGVFSLFLFWRAYKKWLDTELNFGGPDIIIS